MELQIAWRNIWRNPRRTGVILIAVIIGVWSMVFLGALMRGIVEGMIHNGIDTLTGHIQIHQTDYPDDPSVDHTIQDPSQIDAVLSRHLSSESLWTHRVRVTAVANNARHTRGITLVGINPQREAPVSFIGSAVTQGRYLKSDDPYAILVGQALVDQFETVLGHKLILMSEDTNGQIASRSFRIRGIFQAEMEATEKSYAFITLQAAQDMLRLGDGVSEIVIRLPGHDAAEETATLLQSNLAGGDLSVRSWREARPLLTAYLRLYDTFILIWFIVVFVAMGFGIVNTTLMAVFERMCEFGLLKALGMRPGRIVRGILTEALFILLLGMLIGNLLGLMSAWSLSFTGIDLSALAEGVEYAGMSRVIFPVIRFKDIVAANLVVSLLGLLVCLYPAFKAARFTAVEAMAHT